MHERTPGDGTLLVKSRKSTKEEVIKTPYKKVVHSLRMNVLLGVDYESMVNRQREKESKAKIEEAMQGLPSYIKISTQIEPFIAESLWKGKGEHDKEYPKLVVRHKESQERYLVFWPACDSSGKVIPNESHYFDEEGRLLDFKKDLEDYWKKESTGSKIQETDKPIRWMTVKFSNIRQIKANKLLWEIRG